MTALLSCEKNDFDNESANAKLQFSSDTITFDTIFTSIGSITKTLKVYNYNNFDVITDINLTGNSSAHFRMNIDGVSGNNQKNIKIPAQDSIFIFLDIHKPSNFMLPFNTLVSK